jgi:TatD DNase family protein
MQSDAHIHLVDLAGRDPSFPARLALVEWKGCAASHDEPEFRASEAIRAAIASGGRAVAVASFGIHPQWAVWDNADFLVSLAREGRIAAIGEAGFDFYGDRPERMRDEVNERTQRALFEFQLGLAEERGLPLVIHLRKAMDLAYSYSSGLKRLRAAVFHSFSGTARDAEQLLAKGLPAFFSFGAALLNGNKRATAACAAAPLRAILAETDAPWQPPRGRPYCPFEAIADIAQAVAALKGIDPAQAEEALSANFDLAYGIA